ncbi:hypothetical protein L218DRAFT_199020 [Marasmius fiardii PR-910]|nr:hypothetical protein L218DRAFT_199020 [Marasmius fiardii PR-910]
MSNLNLALICDCRVDRSKVARSCALTRHLPSRHNSLAQRRGTLSCESQTTWINCGWPLFLLSFFPENPRSGSVCLGWHPSLIPVVLCFCPLPQVPARLILPSCPKQQPRRPGTLWAGGVGDSGMGLGSPDVCSDLRGRPGTLCWTSVNRLRLSVIAQHHLRST